MGVAGGVVNNLHRGFFFDEKKRVSEKGLYLSRDYFNFPLIQPRIALT